MCFCSLDEGFKSSSYLTETLLDPEFGHASEPNKSGIDIYIQSSIFVL